MTDQKLPSRNKTTQILQLEARLGLELEKRGAGLEAGLGYGLKE